MIPIALSNEELQSSLSKHIKELSRRSTDATVDKVLKHKIVNISDSTAIASTAVETNFDLNKTITTVLYKPGRIFKLICSGVYSTTGTPTLTFKVKIGSTNLIVFTAKTGISGASNQSWKIDADIVCRSVGSSGSLLSHGTLFCNTSSGVDTVETVVNNSAITVDTTISQNLQVSLTWSAASASNTATMKNFILLLSDY